jgi:four helix bundle protein
MTGFGYWVSGIGSQETFEVNRMALRSYRELEVWQRAMDLVEAVYHLTEHFPGEEKFGLTSQIRRAAVSIPANIAEGYGRSHRGDYLRHLSIAKGSLSEMETHLTLAVRLKFVEREQALTCWELAQQVGQMLTRLNQSLRKTQEIPPEPESRNPRPEFRNV